jgi:hypothetical protein
MLSVASIQSGGFSKALRYLVDAHHYGFIESLPILTLVGNNTVKRLSDLLITTVVFLFFVFS